MPGRSLILMERGLALDADGDMLAVRRAGHDIERLPAESVEEVMLFGSVSLSPEATAVLLQRGIDTIFLSPSGRYRGRLVSRPSKNAELRLAQMDRVRDPAFCLSVARAIVAGKLTNQRNLLLRSQREQGRDDMAEAIGAIRRLIESLAAAADVDTVRGLEGRGAAVYFGVFGLCIRNPAFEFKTRTRRPPKDPLNAILSFGYSLLGTRIESLVLRAGLDPMLGVFHTPEHGRPSLMLDLLEELRPAIVDSLALRLVNRRELRPEDFQAPRSDPDAIWGPEEADTHTAGGTDRGVWLGESGRRIFFRAWRQRMHETMRYAPRDEVLTVDDIARHQVYHLARVFRREDPEYVPFVPR